MLISFRPMSHVARRAAGRAYPDIETAAVERWTIAPASRRFIRPAVFLPHHLDRIRATEFGSMWQIMKGFRGNYETHQTATLGYRFRDVDLIDGVLYSRCASRPLRPRHRRIPLHRAPSRSISSGVLYESWAGNRWFGNWLWDDCLTYGLAKQHGSPLTTRRQAWHHEPDYASRLGVRSTPVDDVHFEELILFDDKGENDTRKARAREMRERLTSCLTPGPQHAGVFLLRGKSGAPRALVNEIEIANAFAGKHGFRILDPSTLTVDELIEACAGARIVAGVEGSHLVHGLAAMPPNAALLTLQPPDRVVSVLKVVTDRQDQLYAFVVGEGDHSHFTIDWDDVERTLDLMSKQ